MQVTPPNIRKSFGAVEVVKGLDLDIADGEFLVLLGPSGCGKTTALRMVAGLESVTSGRILIGDARRHPRAAEVPRRGDGLPVLRALPAHDDRREHRLSAEAPRRARRPSARAQVRAAAGKVHLDELLDRYPRQLSGGQRQRVALARAIVRRPERLPDGRAALQPRRQAARPHARRAEAAAGRARRHHDLRHPRPDRGDDAGPPRRGHEQGRRAADRHARARSTTTRPTSSSPASSARRR